MKKRNKIKRFFLHLLSFPWQVSQHFAQADFQRIEAAIRNSERKHSGEIKLVVESGLDALEILRGKTPKQRAIELFSMLRIWDTEHNNGVLIYLLLADRDVEIVADRGIHQQVGQAAWEAICQHMETLFRQGEFAAGVLDGIEKIDTLLVKHFPENVSQSKKNRKRKRNEVSDSPLVL